MKEGFQQETLEFSASFEKVNFKVQPKTEKWVVVSFEMERSGPVEAMKEWQEELQPVINNGIAGFSLVGEEKTKEDKTTHEVKFYHDEIDVNAAWSCEKVTSELLQNRHEVVKIQFAAGCKIEDLCEIPRQLLKFRGQKVDVRMNYIVKQPDQPDLFDDLGDAVRDFVAPIADPASGLDGITISTASPDGTGTSVTITKEDAERIVAKGKKTRGKVH